MNLVRAGAGRKYKKCCGAKEAVSITHVIEGEIDDLQKRLIHFTLDHYEEEILTGFNDFHEHFEIEEDQRQFFEFVYTIWFSLFRELEDGATIVENFIASEAGKIKRPKLAQILQSWTNARAIAGEIIAVENNVLTVIDGLSSEEYKAMVTNLQSPFEKGTFFVGFLLPFDQMHVFFPAPFDLTELPLQQAIDFIKQKSEMAGAGYASPQEFFTDFFMEIMSDLPAIGGMVEVDSIEWQLPVYKEVAERLKRELESLGEIPPIVDLGIILWFQYCEKKQKRIKNPNLYAASLHYLLSTFNNMKTPVTQKDLAKMYGVPVGSLSSTYGELDDELEAEIRSVIDISFEEDTRAVSVNPLRGLALTEQSCRIS